MLDIDEIPAEHVRTETIPSFFSGLVGGLAGLVVGHPFVKVRLQSRELASRYKGTWHCFVTIIKQEKFLGLYKGMASPAAGVAGVNALVFGSHSYFMALQARTQRNPTDQNSPPPLRHTFFAGLGAGLITSLVTCPMELAKVQLQNQTSDAIKGPVDCLAKLYAQGGLRMCFTGLSATALRELSFGPYFLVIQSEPNRYKNTLDCFKQCYQEEGWRVFTRGLSPTIVRAFPSNAATFMAYTWAMNALTTPSKGQHTLRETVTL
ncbi:hypothetical protein [Absidia glauca]|uniref:Mitochondrial carrier protein n=1 Tax=Absidia glauca TaxID=4829 RepID=A0A168T4M9_ABSGL|nr:hypothetical protein [Absidia glauca]